VPDEEIADRPRRRPLLLAMLVAAALLLALAGSGAFAGGGGSSPSSDEGTGVTQQGAPGATENGPTHRGRHCHHGENRQAPQQSPTEDPPV
jgi:hypothetical protein